MSNRKNLELMIEGHPELCISKQSLGGRMVYKIHRGSGWRFYEQDGLFVGSARECIIWLYGYRARGWTN